jgi:hypothetical protein
VTVPVGRPELEIGEASSGGEPARRVDEIDADRLAREGDRARRAWIRLEDVEIVPHEPELNVDEADDSKCRSESTDRALHERERLGGERGGGRTHEESPECTPASSTCSITAATKVCAPSQSASTSISTAPSEEAVDEHAPPLAAAAPTSRPSSTRACCARRGRRRPDEDRVADLLRDLDRLAGSPPRPTGNAMPSSPQSAAKRSRSSARSTAPNGVPRIA